MSLDITPVSVEGTEDVALPSRVELTSLSCLRRCCRGKGEGDFQQSLATYRCRFSRILAAWRMTALIATTTDTMTTRITSKAAIMEPKNRAASTSPITADAINRAASPALSRQNRRGGGERISCASGFRSGDRMICTILFEFKTW